MFNRNKNENFHKYTYIIIQQFPHKIKPCRGISPMSVYIVIKTYDVIKRCAVDACYLNKIMHRYLSFTSFVLAVLLLHYHKALCKLFLCQLVFLTQYP